MEFLAQILIRILVYAPIILLSVVLHELGHALISVWLGDKTPEYDGRLTMNPACHFDANTLLFLLISGLFGGFFLITKPVRTAPSAYKYPLLGEMLVAFAGPVVNLLCAVFLWPFLMLTGGLIPFPYLYELFFSYCLTGIKINLFIALFNLLPIPPLDGSYIWLSFFPYKRFEHFRASSAVYGMWILLFAFVSLLILPNPLVNGVVWQIDNLSEAIVQAYRIIKFP